jgi:hypothetical protein
MARKFFYVCAGMFLLALSYHFGAATAIAQGPGNPVVAAGEMTFSNSTSNFVITSSGELYTTASNSPGTSWVHLGNVFAGGPTPAVHESWGQVKARYQNTPGMTVTPGAGNR